MAGVAQVGAIFDRALSGIGSLITNQEERGKVISQIETARAQAAGLVLEYEGRVFDARARIIEAEAKSESWLTRMWRPILMMGFGFIVFWNMVAPTFGLKPLDADAANLAPELWALLKLGIGGYVIGRSGEKIVKNVVPAIRSGPEDLMKPKNLAKLRRKLAELEAA